MSAKNKQYNWLLVIAVVSLAAFPLVFVKGKYEGSDTQGQAAIKVIHPTYQPWFKPIFEPSAEIASLLFASQAALGAGVIGYVIGLYKGRRQNDSSD